MVGRVLFMYLTEKLKIFVGNLLCAEDYSKFKLDNESSIILRKKDPCEESLSFSFASCC